MACDLEGRRRAARAAALTTIAACAGRSADGRRLYVIVFNKHHAEDLGAAVCLAFGGGPGRASAGRLWRVTGPSLDATNLERGLVCETATAEPVDGLGADGFAHSFPRHSMTAFESEFGR
jgi:hypothetical protein